MYQAAQRFETEMPSNIVSAINSVVSKYPKADTPKWALGNTVNEKALEKSIEYQANHCVVKDSSPGIPYKIFGSSNHEVLENSGVFIMEAVKARLNKILNTPMEDLLKFTASELAKFGYCDPIRVFVKNEPHSKEKMLQGRYRIISSVSLVDNLLQRVIFDEQDRLEIAEWTRNPSQPGLGFTKDMTKRFLTQLPPGEVAEADVSGWDWSVQGWELKAEALMRIKLAKNPTPLFCDALTKVLHIISFSIFSLSDGRLFQQSKPGIMKSGAKITSSSNSRIRVLAHHILNPTNPWCVAMGDDSLENPFPNAPQRYKELGHPVKMFTVRSNDEEVEFCGHFYDRINSLTRPKNITKMVTKYLALSSPNEDQRSALFSEIADALPDEKLFVRLVLRHLGEEVSNASKEASEESC